jgi:hypothetical protein
MRNWVVGPFNKRFCGIIELGWGVWEDVKIRGVHGKLDA